MDTYTHYTVNRMRNGQLAHEMYCSGDAYDTAELARSHARLPNVDPEQSGVALVRVETAPAVRFTVLGKRPAPGDRRLVRMTIIEIRTGAHLGMIDE